jgi:hypothetical protein
VGVVAPDVDSARMPALRADPNQPVQVRASLKDKLKLPEAIKKDDTTQLLAWLTSTGVDVTLDRGANVGRDDVALVIQFFELVLRKEPWLRIRAFTPDPQQPLTLQFKTRASFTPARYDWRFPNGLTYSEAGPLYTFDAPGDYPITLVVPHPANTKRPIDLARTVLVTVPGGNIQP